MCLFCFWKMQEIAAETSSLDQLHGPFLTGSLPSQGHSEILLQAREVKPQLISAVALPCSTHFTLPIVATYIDILWPYMAWPFSFCECQCSFGFGRAFLPNTSQKTLSQDATSQPTAISTASVLKGIWTKNVDSPISLVRSAQGPTNAKTLW